MVIIFKYFCLSELACTLNLQIYKEHKLYVQSWRKRKRMVGKWFISLVISMIKFRWFSIIMNASLFTLYCSSVYFPLQATEILNSILEGYPKPKKQLFVSAIQWQIVCAACRQNLLLLINDHITEHGYYRHSQFSPENISDYLLATNI